MKLRAIRVSDVKRFTVPGKAVEGLDDGLNVLAAENEFGKSTIFEALRVLLFEKHSSRAQKIEALRPYQGAGAPTIELDVMTNEGRFRIQKRYLSRPSALVVDLDGGKTVATGDDVQTWIAAHTGSAKADDGPTGLLWVEQGHSLSQPEAGGESNDVLASLLEREVTEITGGARLRQILTSVKQQKGGLVTAKTEKPTGRYRQALDESAALEDDIQNLEERLRKVEAKRQSLTEAQYALTRLEDPDERKAFTQKLHKAEQAWQDAHGLLRQVEGLEKQGALTERHVETEYAALEKLASAQRHVTGLMDASQRKNDQLRRLKDKYNEKRQALHVAQKALQAQETEFGATHDTLDKSMRLAQAQEAQAQLQAERARLDSARVATKELADANAAVASTRIDTAALRRLEQLSRAVDLAEARLHGGQTKVTVHYEDGGKGKIHSDGAEFIDRETRAVDGRLALQVDGVGRIEIEAGHGAEHTKRSGDVRAARQAFDAALRDTGHSDVVEARAALEAKTTAATDAKAAARMLEQLVPDGLEALQAKIVKLESQAASAAVAAPPVDDARAAYDAARDRLAACRSVYETIAKDANALESELRSCEADVRNLTEQTAHGFKTLGDRDTWPAALKSQNAKVAAATEERDALLQQIKDVKGKVGDAAGLEATLKRLRQAGENRDAEIAQVKQTISGLQAELRIGQSSGVEEKLADKSLQLQRLSAEVARLAEQVQVYDTLIATLEQVEADTQARFFAPVMTELNPLLQQVMPGGALTLDANYRPQYLKRHGVTEMLAHLSGGTQEQIAILTRLAFARLMARKGKVMPVILDDALVFSDDARIERMFNALTLAADDIQLLVLTCRQNAFQDLGGTRLQLVDWQPQT